ncbi:pseudouridine synthase [Caloranaerobacter sp. TR13]|uniref:tRNA pseudouridine(38-40) synthase TruA n=1 Tax=Caloranaerobacter sp. TR13 TaxID=1302151 RepID=UPI0006D3AC9E|nr:tRNA pseudouridine(38-40) synthase TruA [Caloranaerobacter sp. TR13]KPU26792.1 pseudouridine synthase [Caloranaerobacter sp. TR13]
MRNIKLVIEYDGTNYFGWQKQPELKTIQEEIEKAIKKITKEEVKLIGSGRTDKGVHARGQVANFHTNSKIPADKFKFALNSVLPIDISIKESIEVDESFHARYSAKGKEYRYLVLSSKTRSPLMRDYSYHIPYTLDLSKIKEAAKLFIGTYDFRAFMSSRSCMEDTVRTIYDLEIVEKEDLIEFKVTGNGFLYNMVRIIVGTLIEIGYGKKKIEDIPKIIASKDRNKAGHTAQPQGLYLERVFYE